MRGKRAFERNQIISLLVAGSVGYGLGAWGAAAPRTATALSAAQVVALRFPQDLQDWQELDDPALCGTSQSVVAKAAPTGTIAPSNTQVALLNPAPMVAQAAVTQAPAPQAAAVQASAPATSRPRAVLQMASMEQGDRSAAPAPSRPTLPTVRVSAPKIAAAPVHRRPEHPGFVLNDAQIASIKDRLHLTADQEEMWPAVEAALRNIAYNRARHGAPATAAQVASADPNSADVQGLKSAAIPLIMSFNSEQKDEVRSLAHVMGLDQLASQF
jgi:hypothetical protein